ncbi:DUF6713 family protein [Leucobacter sp. NPDC015123]|uniref:DUF6713 family protein n=1 Tax=Leucobacter sp. NPDC015123 TaxID=3364129 RepID=UPI0036F498E8
MHTNSDTARNQHPPRDMPLAIYRCYETSFLALIIHQIDAAYWQEWDMFGVPGGVQGFLVLNALAVGAILFGYRELLMGGRWELHAAVLCGSLGLATAGIHIWFAAIGREEFHLPLSIAAIIACGASGIALLELARRLPRRRRAAQAF